MDTGASVSVIKESLVRKLNLHRQYSSCNIYGVGNQLIKQANQVVNIVIKPINRPVPVISTNAIIMYTLTSHIPSNYVREKDILLNQNNIQLADTSFGEPQEVDLILGTDILTYVFDGTTMPLSSGMTAYGTCFGHVIMGPIRSHQKSDQITSEIHENPTSVQNYGVHITRLEDAVQRFWKSEEPPLEKVEHPDHKECEQLYQNTTVRMPDGKYMVRLPLLSKRSLLGESSSIAFQRFKTLERKMSKNSEFAQKYIQFMDEYEQLGHMTKSEFSFDSEHYFIAHHGIFKKGSDKLRVVFDGSCKSSNKISLNECLHSGAPLQNDITKILLNFRRHRIVFTTDIKMMFRMTWIHPEDRKYQLIYWRKHPSEKLQVYELNTNTYGLRSSPFISIRTLHQLADDWESTHPGSKASETIRRNIFVDDILTGMDSVSEAQQLKLELMALMHSAGYELRKWSSNSKELLQDLPGDHCEQPHQFDNDDKSFIKVLGIQWDPTSDSLSYQINIPSGQAVTKRNILSTIARLYDPCGYCNPIIFRFKVLLQTLFMDGLNWDEPVPDPIICQWEKMIVDLQQLSKLCIPRCMVIPQAVSYSLHGFGDASEKGYASCVYLRTEDSSGNTWVRLVIAKSRVAPKKSRQTIPKLELSAAHLTCQLLNHVAESYEGSVDFKSINAWSDSSIALTWIHSKPHLLQTFECNRVQFIQNSERTLKWRHIQSELNPADIASRGMPARDLIYSELWWSPYWLREPEEKWPESIISTVKELPGYKKNIHIITPLQEWDLSLLERVSSFNKLINVTAYVLRFIRNLRMSRDKRNVNKILSLEESHNATKYWIKRIQSVSFSSEISSLNRGKSVCTSLQKLSIFLDEDGIIRVGGRLKRSELQYGSRHPYLLPKDNKFVQLLIQNHHRSYCHAATNALIAILRREYWITSIRRQVSRVIRNCITCFRFKPSIQPPFMSDLPADRVTAARPFSGTATDFAGPYLVKSSLLRNAKSVKAYLCVFVCLATKAVHLEVVSSLSVEGFIAAFTRFVSRRGLPVLIRSDRGTNFIGANNYLKEVTQFLLDHELILIEEFRRQNINWQFNPPASPHMGGLFEAAVKSAKTLLRREIGESILTFEELSTIFSKIEAILNSRPLVPMSEDPSDLEVLTPGHFLIGQPLIALPESQWKNTKMSRLSRFQVIQKMYQNIWSRWHSEYLTSLQVRNKWYHQVENLKIDDLVLIIDENSLPLQWKRGRIIELYSGKDSVVRSVKLKTQYGELVRPVVKLCKLPTSDSVDNVKSISG